MLYLIGYWVSGVVAGIGAVIYVVGILPYTCCYNLDDWNKLLLEYLKELNRGQSRFDDMLGRLYTIFLWPLKVTWLLCDVIPNVVSMYDAQFKNV